MELEEKDWRDLKEKAENLLRADMVNIEINKLIIERCEKEICLTKTIKKEGTKSIKSAKS